MSTEVKDPPVDVKPDAKPDDAKPPESSTPQDGKPADVKPPADDKPKDPPVEIKYDLKLAEHSPLDAAEVESVAAYARSKNLSPEDAASLLKSREETAARLLERQIAELDTAKTQWAKDVHADKELGGDHYPVTERRIAAVMEKFVPADSQFRKLLDETGYGNHPEFVRFVARIGKAMEDDTPPKGTPGQKREVDRNDPIARAERMFGKKDK